MKNLAFIPARSGSKGLPDKNIREIGGKPLMAYTIEAALASGCFDEVFVSTDSEKYAGIARKYGAQVPFLRSAEFASDTASAWDAVREALQEYRMLGREFDTVMLMQPTSPLRTAEDIRSAFRRMEETGADSVIGVCEVDHSPLWCNTIPADGSLRNFCRKDVNSVNRQALEQYYRVTGAIYLLKVENASIADDASIYEKNAFALYMDRRKSVDIDTEEDLLLAEFLLGRMQA